MLEYRTYSADTFQQNITSSSLPSFLAFLSLISLIHILYSQNIVTIIYLSEKLSIKSINSKKKIFYFTFMYSFFDILSLCKTKVLTFIISLFLKNFS